MSFVRGSNSAFSSSSFFFSSSSSMSRPSLVVLFNFFAIKLLELLHSVLVNRVYHVKDLETLLAESLEEWRGGDASDALASDVVNIVLAFLHAVNILLEADLLIARLGGVVTQKFCNLHSVRGILMDAQLDVLGELFIELLVIVFLFRDLRKHLQALLHKVFLDDTQNLVLLQGLARDVQRQVLRVHNALDERKPLRHQLIAIVHDKHTTHIELDVSALLLGLKHVERRTAGHKE